MVAYGEVDELNAAIGFAAALEPPSFDAEFLEMIQRDLFTIGAELGHRGAREPIFPILHMRVVKRVL